MSASPVRIAFATPADGAALAPLLTALYRHDVPEAPPPAPETVMAHATRLLDPGTPHRLLIAWSAEGAALGLAAIALLTAVSDPRPNRWTQVEMKELFVLPAHRGQGIGRALMARVMDHARAAKACRIDWHVRRDNHRGIAFYQSLGAELVENRLSMRLEPPRPDSN